jgi:hypothetical protein
MKLPSHKLQTMPTTTTTVTLTLLEQQETKQFAYNFGYDEHRRLLLAKMTWCMLLMIGGYCRPFEKIAHTQKKTELASPPQPVDKTTMASLSNHDVDAAVIMFSLFWLTPPPTNSNINCPNKFSDVTPTYYDILSLERIRNHDNDDNFNGNFPPPKTQLQFSSSTTNVGNGLANNKMVRADRPDDGAASAIVGDVVEKSAETPTGTRVPTTIESWLDTNGANNKLGGPTFTCENGKHFQMDGDGSATVTTIGQLFRTVDRQQSIVTAGGQHRIDVTANGLRTPDNQIAGESKY